MDLPRQDRSFLCKSDSVTTWAEHCADDFAFFLNSRRLQSKCVSENLSAFIKYPILYIYQQEVIRLHLLQSEFLFFPDIQGADDKLGQFLSQYI